MRKENARKKGAHAAKQSAILFLCALVCAASIYGIWKLTFGAYQEADVIAGAPAASAEKAPEDSMENTVPPDVSGLPEMEEDEEGMVLPDETTDISAEPTEPPEEIMEMPAGAPDLAETGVPEIIIMADPLDRRGQEERNGEIGRGENVELPLAGLVIGIDAGHQAHGNSDQEPVAPGSSETKAKVSSGTQGTASGVPEYEVNLDVSLMLRDVLVSYGAEVHMVRTTNDVDISNVERALMFNEANADVVLRIHCNGSTNSAAEGIGLYVTKTGPIAEESYAIAKVILDAMVNETGADKDGVFRRDTYSGLNWSEVPSMIVEMGFMSNPQEDMKLQDPEYRQKLVTGMVKGIAQYYERDLEG